MANKDSVPYQFFLKVLFEFLNCINSYLLFWRDVDHVQTDTFICGDVLMYNYLISTICFSNRIPGGVSKGVVEFFL